MTFNEIAWLIQDRDASWGCWLTLEQAKEVTAAEILEGFRALNDARDWLETFKGYWAVLYTGYGYEVSYSALEAAIRYQEDSNA